MLNEWPDLSDVEVIIYTVIGIGIVLFLFNPFAKRKK